MIFKISTIEFTPGVYPAFCEDEKVTWDMLYSSVGYLNNVHVLSIKYKNNKGDELYINGYVSIDHEQNAIDDFVKNQKNLFNSLGEFDNILAYYEL